MLLVPCGQRGCSKEERDAQARPDDLTVSPDPQVHESYHNILLLEGFFPSQEDTFRCGHPDMIPFAKAL